MQPSGETEEQRMNRENAEAAKQSGTGRPVVTSGNTGRGQR